MKSLIAAAVVAGVLLPALAQAAASPPKTTRVSPKIYGDAERGKDVIGMWCISCHKTGAAVDDRVPSLTSLAANPARTDSAIRAFLMQPHKPMPPLELSTQQIEDIIAYLHTLRPESGLTR